MHPILFQIGTFEIRSFAILMVLAFLAGLWMARTRADRFGIDKPLLWDVSFWMLVSGVLGARIVFILQDWSYYGKHLDKVMSLKFEGLTSFGGIVFGFVTLLIWSKTKGVSALKLLDLFGPPFLLASAIGRVGCLLNGCCYGVHTDLPFGVNIQNALGNPHHPAQVYDSLMLLAGLALVLRLERRGVPSGGSISLSLIVYGISRFIYEFWRAGTDAEVRNGIASSTYWDGLPITQAHAISLVIALAGAVFYLICRRKAPVPAETVLGAA